MKINLKAFEILAYYAKLEELFVYESVESGYAEGIISIL
jgi:hypothetical protein